MKDVKSYLYAGPMGHKWKRGGSVLTRLYNKSSVRCESGSETSG